MDVIKLLAVARGEQPADLLKYLLDSTTRYVEKRRRDNRLLADQT